MNLRSAYMVAMLSMGLALSAEAIYAKAITVMAPGGPELKAFLDEVVKDFRKEYPKVEVRIVQADAQAQIEKTSTMLIGGIAPEVIWCSNRYAANWMDQMIMRNLLPYMKQDRVEASAFTQRAYRDLSRGGQQVGLPMDVGLMISFFYPKAFAEAGLPTPVEAAQGDRWTYDSWIKALQRLTITKSGSKPSQYGFQCATAYTPELVDWMCASGGHILNADNTKCLMDGPKSIEGLQVLLDLKRRYGVAMSQWPMSAAPGKVAMWYGPHNQAVAHAKIATIDYAYRPVPTAVMEPHHTLLINHVSMFKACKEPELGWKFMKLMVSEKWQIRLGELTGRMPGLVAAMPAYTKAMAKSVAHSAILAKALSDYSVGLPVNKWWMRLQNTLEPAFNDVFMKDNRDLATVMAGISKQLDVVLKNNIIRK